MPHQRDISPSTYILVCVMLIALTLLTLTVSFAPLPGLWHVVLGLLIGLCKATLVVLFFMHAIRGDRLTWLAIAASGFWLGIILVLTYSDYFTREMIPHMSGH
jgi:cytochrome c oxidase subunit 4